MAAELTSVNLLLRLNWHICSHSSEKYLWIKTLNFKKHEGLLTKIWLFKLLFFKKYESASLFATKILKSICS